MKYFWGIEQNDRDVVLIRRLKKGLFKYNNKGGLRKKLSCLGNFTLNYLINSILPHSTKLQHNNKSNKIEYQICYFYYIFIFCFISISPANKNKNIILHIFALLLFVNFLN